VFGFLVGEIKVRVFLAERVLGEFILGCFWSKRLTKSNLNDEYACVNCGIFEKKIG